MPRWTRMNGSVAWWSPIEGAIDEAGKVGNMAVRTVKEVLNGIVASRFSERPSAPTHVMPGAPGPCRDPARLDHASRRISFIAATSAFGCSRPR